MAYSEILGYLVLFAGFGLLCWRKSFSALFVFTCLAAWEIKDGALGVLHITAPHQVAVIGMLVDLALIIVITGCDLKSKIVLPALFVNMTYAVFCLIEHRLGYSSILQLGYGWVTSLVGVAIILGGFLNDPGGYRSFAFGSWFNSFRLRLRPDSTLVDTEIK